MSTISDTAAIIEQAQAMAAMLAPYRTSPEQLESLRRLLAQAGSAADELATERDSQAAALEKARELHLKRARPSVLDCSCGSVVPCPTRLALATAPERSLRAHDAALIRGLADDWAGDPDAWGDNDKDYRNHLRDHADEIERG